MAPAAMALLGAGIFARDAYLPVLRDLTSEISLRFLWSRSQEAAERLLEEVREWSPHAEAVHGDAGLATILNSPEVQCCAVVLPIQVQPEIVMRVLRAGKHVLQEKPVGATLAEGQAILKAHTAMASEKGSAPIWAVAENFRFEPALHEAGRLVQDLGPMVVVQVDVEVPMTARSKYFTCEWRRDPNFMGAFITDCGVHYVAALRLMTGQEVVSVTGIASHRDESVPPPDTLVATMTLANGCTGTMIISFSSCANKMTWRVVCRDGAVEADRGLHEGKFGYLVTMFPRQGPAQRSFHALAGVEEELKAFARDVGSAAKEGGSMAHSSHWCSSPGEALRDLAVIEAALASSREQGGGPRPVPTAL